METGEDQFERVIDEWGALQEWLDKRIEEDDGIIEKGITFYPPRGLVPVWVRQNQDFAGLLMLIAARIDHLSDYLID